MALPLFLFLLFIVTSIFNVSLASPFLRLQRRQNATPPAASLFNLSPELKNIRTEMIKDDSIRQNEFIEIKNNQDTEQFLLKMVEWQRQKSKVTPEDAATIEARIKKQYQDLRDGKLFFKAP